MVWLAIRREKKFENMFIPFDTIHERDKHPEGHLGHIGRACA